MLLSIIIPCFNSGKYISSTLDMLTHQKLDDCEVIIVNDGSTDNTSEICQGYTEKYANIKIIDKENEGVSVARNIGIEKSNGKYVYFLDSDDTLEPQTLEFYRQVLNSNQDAVFFAFGYYSKYNGKLLNDYSYKAYDNQKIEQIMLKQILIREDIFYGYIC